MDSWRKPILYIPYILQAGAKELEKKLELLDYGVTFLPLTLQTSILTPQLWMLEGQLVLFLLEITQDICSQIILLKYF